MNKDHILALYTACAIVNKRGWTTGAALRAVCPELSPRDLAKRAGVSVQGFYNISDRALRKLAEAVERDKLLD